MEEEIQQAVEELDSAERKLYALHRGIPRKNPDGTKNPDRLEGRQVVAEADLDRGEASIPIFRTPVGGAHHLARALEADPETGFGILRSKEEIAVIVEATIHDVAEWLERNEDINCIKLYGEAAVFVYDRHWRILRTEELP